MKRVIDGKRYDTETAQRIAEASSTCGPSDFRYWSEALYKTPRGAFFLHGKGGAMSRWSEPVGSDARGGGSGILPMSVEDAREWCEANEVDALATRARVTPSRADCRSCS